jgi:hypothetical protein
MLNRTRVFEPSVEQILRFCADEPIERVYLEDAARRAIGRFVAIATAGAFDEPLSHRCERRPVGRRMRGVRPCCRNGASSHDHRGGGRRLRALGSRTAEVPAPRLDRPGQPVYTLDAPPERRQRRAATARDYIEFLVPARAAAHEAEIGIDPLANDPDGFRRRTRAQIADGRSWLWAEDGTILFGRGIRLTPHAVQLQQVWVDPSVRARPCA